MQGYPHFFSGDLMDGYGTWTGFVDVVNQCAANGKTPLANLQSYKWETQPGFLYPTAAQLDVEAYMAIVAGMKGLFFYTFISGGTSTLNLTQPALWNASVQVSTEIQGTLKNALLDGVRTTTANTTDHVYFAKCVYGSETYVIAVNVAQVSHTVSIPFTGTTLTKVFSYRNGTLSLSSNTLSGTLGAEEVQIYKVTSGSTCTLPSGWSGADIGVSSGQSSCESGGTYTIVGAGADIWDVSDQFRYTYKSLNGDGSITAKIVSLQNTNAWAKSGVMIRESLAVGAKHASCFITPGNGLAFQSRSATGGVTANSAQASASAPYWVRITRVGNVFSAYYSSNGSTWTQLGSNTTIAMNTNIYIGTAVTSHVSGAGCTSTISNVTTTGPGASNSIVNFEDRRTTEAGLGGVYNNIDFGSGQWFTQYYSQTGIASKVFAVYNNYTTEQTKTFTIPSGKVLKSISIATTGNPATKRVIISSTGNATATWTNMTTTKTTYNTIWTVAATTITIKITCSDGAAQIAMDDITYGDPSNSLKSAAIKAGITEIETLVSAGDIMLYPNPATTNITISNIPENSNIVIFTIYGKIVSKIKANSNEARIDVSTWNKGMYILQVQSKSGIATKQLIVK